MSPQSFPQEIWRMIVQTQREDSDLVFLWTVLRNVNSMLRQFVDEWVAKRYLPDMVIMPRSALIESRALFELVWESPFSHTSRLDSSRAIFRLAPTQSIEEQKMIARTWAADIGCPLQDSPTAGPPEVPQAQNDTQAAPMPRPDPILLPPAFVILRYLANDTPLADPLLDADAGQLSLDWKKTFSSLLYEEALRLRLHREWRRSVQEEKQRLNAALSTAYSDGVVPSGPRPPRMRVGRMALAAHGSPLDDSARRARSVRLKRQQEERGGPILSGLADPRAVGDRGTLHINGFERVELLTQQTNTWLY